jgi:hypothetical protein
MCVSGRHDHDGQSGEADQHPYSEASKSIYARTDTFWPYFDRLRQEDAVHYCKDSMFGPYWSVTKYNDIMDIETPNPSLLMAASFQSIAKQ